MKSNIMTYEKTGNMRSKKNTVEQGYFKELSSYNIVVGGLRELYKRYSTELWATLCIVTWAIAIYRDLGL